MLVTREADYAIRTVLYLARERERKANVSEIAHAMHIPKSFLAKILQRLVRNNILTSVRGVMGGFRLARKPIDITLLAVLEAIQGPAAINLCAVDGKKCKLSSTCCVHPIWIEIRKDVEKRLQKQTIANLLEP
jgi:Rrf2 family protein